MKPQKIEEIRVYDPKSENLDKETFDLLCSTARQYGVRNLANLLRRGLHDKLTRSSIGNGQTLRTFLYGPEGYFSSHHQVSAVMFADGRFQQETWGVGGFVNDFIENESRRLNAIPFVLGAPIETGEVEVEERK